MKFMMIVRATEDSESGALPQGELVEAMGRFNEEMAKAGVLLSADGLQASSKGARVHFSGGKTTVIDGPFAETKELIAGFWMIQVKSKEEAIQWAKKCPPPFGADQEGELELRRVFEAADFTPESMTPAAQESERVVRAELEKRAAR
jgi:hypothetical protein